MHVNPKEYALDEKVGDEMCHKNIVLVAIIWKKYYTWLETG